MMIMIIIMILILIVTCVYTYMCVYIYIYICLYIITSTNMFYHTIILTRYDITWSNVTWYRSLISLPHARRVSRAGFFRSIFCSSWFLVLVCVVFWVVLWYYYTSMHVNIGRKQRVKAWTKHRVSWGTPTVAAPRRAFEKDRWLPDGVGTNTLLFKRATPTMHIMFFFFLFLFLIFTFIVKHASFTLPPLPYILPWTSIPGNRGTPVTTPLLLPLSDQVH